MGNSVDRSSAHRDHGSYDRITVPRASVGALSSRQSRDRSGGVHKLRDKVAPTTGRSVIDRDSIVRRRTEEPPLVDPRRSLGSFRLPWTVLSARRPRVMSVGVLLASVHGQRPFFRRSTRPVLKHGPRSLTCARVMGLYETQRRNEGKGVPSMQR